METEKELLDQLKVAKSTEKLISEKLKELKVESTRKFLFEIIENKNTLEDIIIKVTNEVNHISYFKIIKEYELGHYSTACISINHNKFLTFQYEYYSFSELAWKLHFYGDFEISSEKEFKDKFNEFKLKSGL